MELEQMSSAELISLVRRQEQELAEARAAQQGGGELPQDEHLNMALHLVDACMDVTMVEPEDAAAWQIVRRQFLAQRAASVPAQAGQPQEPPMINTQEARLYLVDFMMQHFTDKTFKRYIIGEATRNALAGDFAWQMARALRMLAAPVPAASVQPVSDRALFEKHITDNHPTACLDRHPNLPYLYALSWVNEGWLAWRKAISGVQPDIGRDAALAKLVRYGFDGTLGGDFGECEKGPYWMVKDVERALATQTAPEVASVPDAVLTDEQIVQISEDHTGAYGVKPVEFARAVLAAAQQPKASYD